jgi:hypothetical protein
LLPFRDGRARTAPDKHGRFDPRDDAQRPDWVRDRLSRVFRVIRGGDGVMNGGGG